MTFLPNFFFAKEMSYLRASNLAELDKLSFAYSFLSLSYFFCYILLSSTNRPHGYFFPDHTLEESGWYPPDTLPRLDLQSHIPATTLQPAT